MKWLLLLLVISTGQAADLTVCSSGCDYTTVDAAIAASACGGTITVTAGQTVVPFTLTDKSGCTTLTVIRSSQAGNLTIGQRVTTADAANLFNVRKSGGADCLISLSTGAHHWRIHGMYAAFTTGQDFYNVLCLFYQPAGSDSVGSIFATAPHLIYIDQSVIATPVESQTLSNTAIALATRLFSLSNSTLYTYAPATESHGISGSTMWGPVYVRNTQITNSTIGTIFGGSTPNVKGARVNGYFSKGNYYYRPWSWRVTSGSGAPTGSCNYDSNGGEWWLRTSNSHWYQCSSGFAWVDQGAIATPQQTTLPKNHYEIKNGWGATAEGLVMENGWVPALLGQKGQCVLHNLVDTFERQAVVAYTTMTNSICKNVPLFMNNGLSATTDYNYLSHHGSFQNILGMNLGALPQSTDSGSTVEMTAFQSTVMSNYSVLNSTFIFNEPSTFGASAVMSSPATDMAFVGLIMPWMAAGFRDDSGGGGSLWNAVWNQYGASRNMGMNVIPNDQSATSGGNPYPVVNLKSQILAGSATPNTPPMPCASCELPNAWSDIGFTSFSVSSVTPGDFKLGGGSAYLKTGPYGKAPGADTDVVGWATQGTASGAPNPYLDFQVRKLIPASTTAAIRYQAYNAETCALTVSPNADYSSPAFTNTDSGGALDRAVNITGLMANTRYFWKVVCGSTGWRRSDTSGGLGPFITTL